MKQFINKKNRKRLIAGAAALTMLTAAFAGTLSVSAQEDTMVRSFLTGKPVPESIGRKKAISVMLNNIQDALPQYRRCSSSSVPLGTATPQSL